MAHNMQFDRRGKFHMTSWEVITMRQHFCSPFGIALFALTTVGCGTLQDRPLAPVELKERWNAKMINPVYWHTPEIQL